MGSGAGVGATGGGAAGEFAAAGPGTAEFVADLFAELGEECGKPAELFAGGVTGLAGAGLVTLVGAGSGATAASELGSGFFSSSFFFATGEITIDTTGSFCTSAKP